ncbi:LuxR family two component transcriptional regulator [Cupriavidus gilardii J11]|uniref:LuxR family two component transcriptional regulator n=1 Tax=Cupriavidus gilardii J11 TaxID=936133 RepID=A0A562B7H4_9BURK|nr:response regulator transcription factor [Cupriavidus gilardii]TWG81136.1 LuxR family two component transcriptional regulator [Cupriavidus gilardii J11]
MLPNPDAAAAGGEVVLVVDDAPQTLHLLCATLGHAGYTVLVAHDGESALARLELATPDAILMDAIMPGISGFETCRRIKAVPSLHHVPVIFMTGLSESEHVVRGFDSGGVDYVVKPVRESEVLARLATHVRNARAARLAREAVDVGGHGVVMVDAHGRVAWRSPRADRWLREFFPECDGSLPVGWAAMAARSARQRGGEERDTPLPPDHAARATRAGATLVARSLGPIGIGESMLLLHVEEPGPAAVSRLDTAALTPREAEVLSWVAKGKTNRDIGDILGISARTVNKHLEHIFEKLGVETRAAAAALASRELAGRPH